MTEEEVLLSVLARLEKLRIPHMLTGSFASNYYGQPRSTGDADVVVHVESKHVPSLLRAFKKDFYISKTAVEEAIRLGRSFNVIHFKSAFKVDIVVRQDRPFSKEELSRRRHVTLWGQRVWIASAEDVILSKLEWAKLGGSEQKFRDALEVYRVQRGALDMTYLKRWARELLIYELLEQVTAAS